MQCSYHRNTTLSSLDGITILSVIFIAFPVSSSCSGTYVLSLADFPENVFIYVTFKIKILSSDYSPKTKNINVLMDYELWLGASALLVSLGQNTSLKYVFMRLLNLYQ